MKNNESSRLFDQNYWDSYYENPRFFLENENQVTAWLTGLFENIKIEGSCFEVGCFPGTYLAIFGKMGLELNGIDLTPRVKELPDQLSDYNFKIGKFYNEDFFLWKPNRKYDIVCSFGFVEHFENWLEVIKKQADLVKDGGYLVIEAPNFHGLLQRWPHYFIDKKNYQRHNISAMSPRKWSALISSEFEILYSGYFGGFDFWVDVEKRDPIKQYILDKIVVYLPLLKRIFKKDRHFYSPYCGILAKRKIINE